jgi:catechol 2,3-dioxygenase-like lactoylglutathione lyase family enzyme
VLPSRSSEARGTIFEGAQPILRVTNLQRSIEYYVNVLGFRIDFHELIASVSRDRCGLFLVQNDQGNSGTWVWVGVSDVDSIHEEYRSKGARIRQSPTNFPGACEMQVEDPDGNVLRLGSESKSDQPFGPWLDMRGDLWEMKEANGFASAVVQRPELGLVQAQTACALIAGVSACSASVRHEGPRRRIHRSSPAPTRT